MKAPAEPHSAIIEETIEDGRDEMFIAAPFPCPCVAVEQVIHGPATDPACAMGGNIL
ncbi:hypothetical protein GCM10009087_12260 [Sphingomonas oligophenolica]